MEYQLLTLIFASPHVNPSTGIPSNPIVKPAVYRIVLIVLLAVHPVAVVIGFLWHRYREREIRIRLEEEIEDADERARRAERRREPAPPAASAAAAAGGAPAPPKKKTPAGGDPEREPLV